MLISLYFKDFIILKHFYFPPCSLKGIYSLPEKRDFMKIKNNFKKLWAKPGVHIVY